MLKGTNTDSRTRDSARPRPGEAVGIPEGLRDAASLSQAWMELPRKASWGRSDLGGLQNPTDLQRREEDGGGRMRGQDVVAVLQRDLGCEPGGLSDRPPPVPGG